MIGADGYRRNRCRGYARSEAANPLDEVGEADPTRRRCASRPRRRPRGSRPVRRPALGPDGRCCRSAIVGAYLLLEGAPAPVLLLFIIAGLIALLLNPFVTLLQRARHPARRRGGDRDASALVASSVGARLRCSPTRSPTRSRASSATSRATSTTPTPSSPTCRTGSTDDGIDIEVKQRGRDGAADDRRADHRWRRRRRRASRATRCSGSSRPRFALILIDRPRGLHADLRRPHRRRACAAIVPPGDGTARGQLTDSRAGGAASATCAARRCSA